jgi:hypothetical protein
MAFLVIAILIGLIPAAIAQRPTVFIAVPNRWILTRKSPEGDSGWRDFLLSNTRENGAVVINRC